MADAWGDAARATGATGSPARQQHFTGEEHAYVGELAVEDGAEDGGVGRALMAAAERWAAGRGFGLVVLETGAANRRARGFYARLG